MKALVFTLLLVCGVMSAYNITRAKNMAYVCAAAFGTEAEINSWTCKYCQQYKLTNVQTLRPRPKHSTTLFWTSSDTLDSPQTTRLSLLLLEAPSAFKTGLWI